MSLHEETIALLKKYRATADSWDAAYLRDADPRAIQGGDFSWDARDLRKLADQLREIAADVENLGG